MNERNYNVREIELNDDDIEDILRKYFTLTQHAIFEWDYQNVVIKDKKE